MLVRSWTERPGVVNNALVIVNVEPRPCGAGPVGEIIWIVQVMLSPGDAVVGPFIET